MDDSYDGFSLLQKKNMLNVPLIKNKQKKQMTSNISSQAITLAESVCHIENLFVKNNSLKKAKEMKSNVNELKSHDKNIQSQSLVNLEDLPPGNFHIEVKEKFIDLFKPKNYEDSDTFTCCKKNDSEYSTQSRSKNIKDQFVDVKKDYGTKTSNEIRSNDNTNVFNISKSQKPLDDSYISIKSDDNKLRSIEIQNIIKLDLQRKYKDNKTTTIKLRTETGIHKIKASVTKTLSGNIAVDINKLCDAVKIDKKERNVALTRSDSGAIILNEKIDDFTNAVIRKTASGSFLLVLVDPVFQTRKIAKSITPPIDRFYKVRIESLDYDTAEPPAVLKLTSSHNYLVVPDKEYVNPFKETIHNLFEDSTEYYINLTKTDSQNYVIQVDDSWRKNEPNALVVKTNSRELKILKRRNTLTSVDSGRKRTSVASSSKVLGEIMDKLPRSIDSARLSISSKKSMMQKKSNSDSNVYEKVKLFYPDYKNLLADPSAILKMTNLGQYAVVLNKESKVTFIKNLKSYLKNNSQGLIPIKKTESGEITIVLNGEQTEKNHYGSLKITLSGNLYVIVDKELVRNMTEGGSLYTDSVDNCVTDVNSRHIIGKLQCPVNKAVTTTCNAMPGNDCDKSKCACSDIKFNKKEWIFNRDQTDRTINYSQICGIDWIKLTSGPDGSNNIRVDESKENGSHSPTNNINTKQLPHNITINPCTCEPQLENSHVNQPKSINCIEAVCPINESVSNWPHVSKDVQNDSSWDSLNFLPPQLPDFLKKIIYN